MDSKVAKKCAEILQMGAPQLVEKFNSEVLYVMENWEYKEIYSNVVISQVMEQIPDFFSEVCKILLGMEKLDFEEKKRSLNSIAGVIILKNVLENPDFSGRFEIIGKVDTGKSGFLIYGKIVKPLN